MGARLNAVEVGNPETFLVYRNKQTELFTPLYCGDGLRGMGCKGEQQWLAEAQQNHCRYGEWKMVFCVHPDLALTFAAAIVGTG